MLTQDMNNIANWLDKNKLIINLKKCKTESTLFSTGQRLYEENDNQLILEIKAFVTQHPINTWKLL